MYAKITEFNELTQKEVRQIIYLNLLNLNIKKVELVKLAKFCAKL
jgi:hypothetical protein